MSYSANAELITEHSKNVKQNRSLRVVRAPGVARAPGDVVVVKSA